MQFHVCCACSTGDRFQKPSTTAGLTHCKTLRGPKRPVVLPVTPATSVLHNNVLPANRTITRAAINVSQEKLSLTAPAPNSSTSPQLKKRTTRQPCNNVCFSRVGSRNRRQGQNNGKTRLPNTAYPCYRHKISPHDVVVQSCRHQNNTFNGRVVQ